jgi:SNF2 family DNA or RNA helicase
MGIQKSKLQILKGLILLRQIANHPRLVDPGFLGESGKFLEITRMLEMALQEGHKVLLFSQFVKHLRLFREYADNNNIEYCYLDGSVTGKDRMEEVNRFNGTERIKLFLISLKAGGTGLNLTSADYVFLADPWWNPAVERQAIDRTHRIGQTQKVFSYKYISKNSIEEKILRLQERKSLLANELVPGDENLLKHLQIEEIEELLD